MAPSTTTTFSLRTVLEKDKLNGNNYADWIRNLRIVLRAEKTKTFLITPYQKNQKKMLQPLKRMLTRKHVMLILK